MRFESGRVIEHASALGIGPRAGPEDHRRVVDDLAGRFRLAGLDVGPARPPTERVAQVFGSLPSGSNPTSRVVLLVRLRRDDRTSPALLAELARTWPRRIAEQVACSFGATSHIGAAVAELTNLREGEAGRTLVITLDAPGVGPDLIVVGRGPGARLAESAARDLWLPHRSARWLPRRLGHLAFQLAGMPCVGLCGSRTLGRIDPATLAATAQLVTEIALRWAKEPLS